MSCEQYVNAFLSYYYREPDTYTHCFFADEVVKNDAFWQFVRSGTWDKTLTNTHTEQLERITAQNRQRANTTAEQMIETIVRNGYVWKSVRELYTWFWNMYAQKHTILAEDSRLPWVLRDFHNEWAQRIQHPSFDFTQTPRFAYLHVTEWGMRQISLFHRLQYRYSESEVYYVGTSFHKEKRRTELLEEMTMIHSNRDVFGSHIALPAYYIFPDKFTRYCEDIPRKGFEIAYITYEHKDADVLTAKTLRYTTRSELQKAVSERVWQWFVSEYGTNYTSKITDEPDAGIRKTVHKQLEENEWIADMFGTKDNFLQYREQELQARIERENIAIAAQEAVVTTYDQACQQYKSKVDKFGDDLLTVCALLQIEPIGEYEKPETISDLARKLSRLVERYGFVRVGGKVYQIKTPDRPASVDDAEYDRRFAVIREQTRKKYCKSKEDIEQSFAEKRKGGVKKKTRTKDTQEYDTADTNDTKDALSDIDDIVADTDYDIDFTTEYEEDNDE